MRERDRRTYTVVWVAVTAVAAGILVLVGSLGFAAALVAVAVIGLVAFLRATHPGGDDKPHLGIFFDEPTSGPADRASSAAPPAPAGADRGDAEIIDLRQPARRDRSPVLTVNDAVAASEQARQATEPSEASEASEASDELAEHHVRLLRQVEVKLRDYQ